jgi:hypothetical protein
MEASMDEDDAREIKRRTLEWGNLFYAPVKASAAVLEELAPYRFGLVNQFDLNGRGPWQGQQGLGRDPTRFLAFAKALRAELGFVPPGDVVFDRDAGSHGFASVWRMAGL